MRMPKVMAIICPLLSPSSVVLSSVIALAVAACREQKYSHYHQGSFSYQNHMQTSRPSFFIQGDVQGSLTGHASLENTLAVCSACRQVNWQQL